MQLRCSYGAARVQLVPRRWRPWPPPQPPSSSVRGPAVVGRAMVSMPLKRVVVLSNARARAARTRFSAGVISSLAFFFSFLLLPHELSSAAACQGDAQATQPTHRASAARERACMGELPNQAHRHTRRHRLRLLPGGRAHAPALRQPPCAPLPLRLRQLRRPLSRCPWLPSPTSCPCALASSRAPPPPSRAAPP